MRRFHFAFALTLALFFAAPARADLPPPDTEGCRMSNAGDPCDPDGKPSDGGTKPGICRKATCSRLDYASWNRDASATPPTMEYECLKCIVGGDAGATGGSGGAAGAPGTGGVTGTGGTPAKSDSGCAVSGPRAAFGPWLLAGGFALCVWFGRRRRR